MNPHDPHTSHDLPMPIYCTALQQGHEPANPRMWRRTWSDGGHVDRVVWIPPNCQVTTKDAAA